MYISESAFLYYSCCCIWWRRTIFFITFIVVTHTMITIAVHVFKFTDCDRLTLPSCVLSLFLLGIRNSCILDTCGRYIKFMMTAYACAWSSTGLCRRLYSLSNSTMLREAAETIGAILSRHTPMRPLTTDKQPTHACLSRCLVDTLSVPLFVPLSVPLTCVCVCVCIARVSYFWRCCERRRKPSAPFCLDRRRCDLLPPTSNRHTPVCLVESLTRYLSRLLVDRHLSCCLSRSLVYPLSVLLPILTMYPAAEDDQIRLRVWLDQTAGQRYVWQDHGKRVKTVLYEYYTAIVWINYMQ